MDICLRVLKESNKSRFDSYSIRSSVLLISHITFRDCRVHIFPTTFLEIAVYVQCFSRSSHFYQEGKAPWRRGYQEMTINVPSDDFEMIFFPLFLRFLFVLFSRTQNN